MTEIKLADVTIHIDRETDADTREQLELGKDDDGVVIAGINSESVAGNGGLRQGDLVTEVNGARVRSAGEFYRAIGRDADEIQFRIVRGGQGLTFGFDKPSA